jgi:hypothetical protein
MLNFSERLLAEALFHNKPLIAYHLFISSLFGYGHDIYDLSPCALLVVYS